MLSSSSPLGTLIESSPPPSWLRTALKSSMRGCSQGRQTMSSKIFYHQRAGCQQPGQRQGRHPMCAIFSRAILGTLGAATIAIVYPRVGRVEDRPWLSLSQSHTTTREPWSNMEGSHRGTEKRGEKLFEDKPSKCGSPYAWKAKLESQKSRKSIAREIPSSAVRNLEYKARAIGWKPLDPPVNSKQTLEHTSTAERKEENPCGTTDAKLGHPASADPSYYMLIEASTP